MSVLPHAEERRAVLADALGVLRSRIDAACAEAGRQSSEVTLVAVTKTYPASDVLHLAELGVTDVGENRDSDAAPKAELVRAAGVHPRWHFIGQLQRNKCRSVVGYADLVHSVDRAGLADALANAVMRERPERPLEVLIQVGLDGDPTRGGVPPEELGRLADAVAGRPELRLRGLMTVAPLDWEPAHAFSYLLELSEAFRVGYPTATLLSAGMSGDLLEAIRYGATHVRVGSALLGSRPPAGLA